MQAMLCQRVPNREGHKLAADVWLPDGPGPFPVLITRTPYHRRGGLGLARRYTEAGYAYVIQDTRGKYDSEGHFRPMVYEAEDGQALIEWVAEQSWCKGRIGLVGASYLGMVQLPAASRAHPALRCIAPAVAPNHFFHDWLRYDGAFQLANAIRWPMTHAVCPTQPQTDHFTWQELYSLGTLEEIERRAGYSAPELREWVRHDVYDEYWAALDQTLLYERITVPGLHVAGWFDHISRGQFEAYQGISATGATELARSSQRLFVGPWGHSTLGKRSYGVWDFGPEAELDRLAYELRFLDLWLRDVDDGFSEELPVRVFLMGANRWLNVADWPPPEAEVQRWYLHSAGEARGLGSKGRLSPEEPAQDTADGYVYDPSDPCPTWGGPLYWGLEGLGPQDQRKLLMRQDVLYYRSEPLSRPLAVMGEVNLRLWVASDAEDTDFVVKLNVVEPGGRIVCLTSGCMRCRYREMFVPRAEGPSGGDDEAAGAVDDLRWLKGRLGRPTPEQAEPRPLSKGEPALLHLQLGNLAYVFPAGSRIALTVTSSSFPRILPHPNTMAPTWQETAPRPATNQIIHSPTHPSHLLLPVVDTQ